MITTYGIQVQNNPKSPTLSPQPNLCLQHIHMAPVIAILAETPSHDAANVELVRNIYEFALHKLRCIPRPEQLCTGIKIVLSALVQIGYAVFLGAAP
jgi:hypothetical protein